ncbi:RrF2 family transcriptional regulator [Lacipirellula parvula]|uniref:RrF2 family transcriptional regulator n=1 Tax=Lacipirellula parvula TaxID=2650471 RepID=UPI0012608ACD|nr:Rrf2 family transcriptional regulator [Lacipirellula parvula]
MRISRASTYALLATVQLSDSPASPPIPCSQLAQLGDMPERFLLQVLRNLVNEGLLKSTRGVDGGYRLAKPLSQITMLEIVEAIDGPVQPELPQIGGLQPQSQKKLAEVLGDVAGDAKKRLASVTLAQLKPVAATAANGSKARRTG